MDDVSQQVSLYSRLKDEVENRVMRKSRLKSHFGFSPSENANTNQPEESDSGREEEVRYRPVRAPCLCPFSFRLTNRPKP